MGEILKMLDDCGRIWFVQDFICKFDSIKKKNNDPVIGNLIQLYEQNDGYKKFLLSINKMNFME